MSQHSAADAKNHLSDLINRSLAGNPLLLRGTATRSSS
jgi:antitoxin (DNA-binding transcriptional repressor) of toxin-antitoxin stability system